MAVAMMSAASSDLKKVGLSISKIPPPLESTRLLSQNPPFATMRINENTALSTPTVLLVPYSIHHVPTYHEWMQDPALQAATASEPLSLDEEYAMQRSWRTDPDKLTFIICSPLPDGAPTATDPASIEANEADGPAHMIGDINLFLFGPESAEMEEDVARVGGDLVGEVELMIARAALQRRGFGKAALLVFLDYVVSNWAGIAGEYARQRWEGKLVEGETDAAPRLSFLRVKVKVTNVGSIRLFESVGFVRTVEEANYFGEVELRWLPGLERLRKVKGWEKAVRLEYRG